MLFICRQMFLGEKKARGQALEASADPSIFRDDEQSFGLVIPLALTLQ